MIFPSGSLPTAGPPGVSGGGVSPPSERSALVAIAVMALIDDDFCGHDVIETLKAFGLGSVVRDAREQVTRMRRRG